MNTNTGFRPLVKSMIYSKKHRSVQIRLLSLRTIFRRDSHVLPRELMNLSQRKSGGRKRISVWPERKQQRLIRRASNILLTMSTAGIAKEFADKVKDGNVVNLVKPSHFEISAFNKLSKRFDQKPLFFLIQNKVLTEDVIKIIKQKFPSWVNKPENKDVTETDQSSSDENESDTDTLS